MNRLWIVPCNGLEIQAWSISTSHAGLSEDEWRKFDVERVKSFHSVIVNKQVVAWKAIRSLWLKVKIKAKVVFYCLSHYMIPLDWRNLQRYSLQWPGNISYFLFNLVFSIVQQRLLRIKSRFEHCGKRSAISASGERQSSLKAAYHTERVHSWKCQSISQGSRQKMHFNITHLLESMTG